MSTELTREQKRIRIAEACGITHAWDVPRNPVGATACGWLGWSGGKQVAVPDYFGSLDAMHEAEKTLLKDGPDSDLWLDYLMNVVACAPAWLSNHATAAERAEAFGRTLNLW